MYISKAMVKQEQVEEVFSIALQCMNPEERDRWEKSLQSYFKWKENPHPFPKDTPFLYIKERVYGKESFDHVKEMTASALNERDKHPVLSNWMMQLEKTVSDQEKRLSDASNPKKKIEPFSEEQTTLRALEISLIDNRFLLAYCTGLARTIHKVKHPVDYDPNTELWFEVANYLCEEKILTTREIDGISVFVPADGFTGRSVFNETVKKYLRRKNKPFPTGRETPLSVFVSLGLLYKPQANERYETPDEVGKYCDGKKSRKNRK